MWKHCTLLFTVSLFLFGCATGSSIVTGKTRPAISPSDVKLYLDPPLKYETIGIVEASGEVGFSAQEARDMVVNELKVQAAKIGANGAILLTTGDKSSEMVGFYSAGVFYAGASEHNAAQGRAIYVTQE